MSRKQKARVRVRFLPGTCSFHGRWEILLRGPDQSKCKLTGLHYQEPRNRHNTGKLQNTIGRANTRDVGESFGSKTTVSGGSLCELLAYEYARICCHVEALQPVQRCSMHTNHL